MARPIKNFKKHGYSHGLSEMSPENGMRLFCIRRGNDVAQSFMSSLSYQDLIARAYYQGILDGKKTFGENNDSK